MSSTGPSPSWGQTCTTVCRESLSFLAYLGEITHAERYRLLAATICDTPCAARLVQHPAGLTTIGGYSGWGGVIYTLTHLAVLWEQTGLACRS